MSPESLPSALASALAHIAVQSSGVAANAAGVSDNSAMAVAIKNLVMGYLLAGRLVTSLSHLRP